MHKVKRNSAPNSLIVKNQKYLEKLDNGVTVNQPWGTLNIKERKEILQNLNEIYHGCCAYCESEVETTSSPRIEHFRPKSLFPRLIFEYDNMNYSCERCNTFKGDKWNELYFSPSEENPEEHIKFDKTTAVPIDERGNEMIELVQLNRDKLIENRKNKYDLIETYINVAYKKYAEIDYNNIMSIKNFLERFDEAYNSYIKSSSIETNYSTMIRQNFLEKVNDLQEKRNKLLEFLKNMQKSN